MIAVSLSPTRTAVQESGAMQALERGMIPVSALDVAFLDDRNRLLEEIYELRRFKAAALDLIESMSRETGR